MKFLFFFLVFVIGVVSVISDDDFHRIGVNEPEVKSAVKWLMNKTKFALVKNTKEVMKNEQAIPHNLCHITKHINKHMMLNLPSAKICNLTKMYYSLRLDVQCQKIIIIQNVTSDNHRLICSKCCAKNHCATRLFTSYKITKNISTAKSMFREFFEQMNRN
ncbi:hypothetical protein BLOT_006040 [Blomia tropicalis]|nr:hypothetical protein BLOT_006040 [Blomia tropicalis]